VWGKLTVNIFVVVNDEHHYINGTSWGSAIQCVKGQHHSQPFAVAISAIMLRPSAKQVASSKLAAKLHGRQSVQGCAAY